MRRSTAAAKILGNGRTADPGAGRRRTGCLAPRSSSLAQMLEAPVSARIAGAAASSRAHIGWPSTCRSAIACGRKPTPCSRSARASSSRTASWGIDDKLKVVRIDIDPDEPDRLPQARRRPDRRRRAAQLRALIDGAAEAQSASVASRDGRSLKGHRDWFAERLSRLEPQMSFLQGNARGRCRKTASSSTRSRRWASPRALPSPIEKPRTYLSPGYQDNLGWGFGTALGAKAAMPDKQGAGDRGRRRLSSIRSANSPPPCATTSPSWSWSSTTAPSAT